MSAPLGGKEKKQCLEPSCTGVLREVQGSRDSQTLATTARGWQDMDSGGSGCCSLCICVFCSCIFQVWKLLQQVITENCDYPSLSSSYKNEFKQKTSRCETSLILGVSPSAAKAEIRIVHRKIRISN